MNREPAGWPSRLRHRVMAAAVEPFTHGPRPLDDTHRYPGDPGLFGPDSVTWRVIGREATMIGGLRGLLVQAAHPEVVAGVADHSRYRDDPLGRLNRTANYVTESAFGAMPEVHAAVAQVRARHRPVVGTSHRGRGYTADTPELAAWVHNALVDSFLVCHQAYSHAPLSAPDADRFVAEQGRLGRLLDADPLPETAPDLSAWIGDHPDLGPAPGMTEAVAFLRSPPLSRGQRAGYHLILRAAVATLPPRLRRILGLQSLAGPRPVGVGVARALHWALGDSPAWQAALHRVGVPDDVGRFIRPLV